MNEDEENEPDSESKRWLELWCDPMTSERTDINMEMFIYVLFPNLRFFISRGAATDLENLS